MSSVAVVIALPVLREKLLLCAMAPLGIML